MGASWLARFCFGPDERPATGFWTRKLARGVWPQHAMASTVVRHESPMRTTASCGVHHRGRIYRAVGLCPKSETHSGEGDRRICDNHPLFAGPGLRQSHRRSGTVSACPVTSLMSLRSKSSGVDTGPLRTECITCVMRTWWKMAIKRVLAMHPRSWLPWAAHSSPWSAAWAGATSPITFATMLSASDVRCSSPALSQADLDAALWRPESPIDKRRPWRHAAGSG